MKLKANKFVTPVITAAALSLLPVEVLAQFAGDEEILRKSCGAVTMIRTWIFRIAYILGAIGLVVIAISAFLGRFKFAHLIALGGGLFIVAASDALISFVTEGSDDDSCASFGGATDV